MKATYVRRTSAQNLFSVSHYSEEKFLKLWHYHKEFELVMVMDSTAGTLFVGDTVSNFFPGDLFLLGSSLPHMLMVPDNIESGTKSEAIGIHFLEDFFGEKSINYEEFKNIKVLFEHAERGVRFTNVTDDIREEIIEIYKSENFDRYIKFLKLLQKLALTADFELMASKNYTNQSLREKNNNLNKIYEFIYENFNQDISLDKVAEIACMNPSAFSRYFKKTHGDSFIKYVNKLRVQYACRLILNNQLSIQEICFEVGFNNVSNFNRHFKNMVEMSPREYQNVKLSEAQN